MPCVAPVPQEPLFWRTCDQARVLDFLGRQDCALGSWLPVAKAAHRLFPMPCEHWPPVAFIDALRLLDGQQCTLTDEVQRSICVVTEFRRKQV